MRVKLLIALFVTGQAHSQVINVTQRVADITKPPPAVVAKCRDGCYVLTHKELMAGLFAAQAAERRSIAEAARMQRENFK